MDILALAHDYEASTWYLTNIVNGLSNSDLDKCISGGWSPRQVIHHLADSEAQSYTRIRRLVAEPAGSLIQGYDEVLWADSPILGYKVLPVENSLAVYVAVRAASLDIIKRLSESDLEKYGEHSESGRYTIAKWIETYSGHPRDHGDQITEAVGA